MAEVSAGSADAKDAGVEVDETPDPVDEAERAQADAQGVAEARKAAEDAVDSARDKVARQKEHLRAAELALEDASDALSALKEA